MGRVWVGRVGVTHVLLVLGVERGDDRGCGGGVVAVRLDVEIVRALGADLAPRRGRGLLLEQAHHGARGWGTRREVLTFGAVASHAETFARGELRVGMGVRSGSSVARWEGNLPRARETPRVRRRPQRLAMWSVKAQAGVTKNVPEASVDEGVRARWTTGRGFAPRGRRAGYPRARSARFPRGVSLAAIRTNVPPESPWHAISRLRSPRYLASCFACATPHLSVDRRTPSPGVLDPRFTRKTAARSTGTLEVDVRSKRAATLPSRADNTPRLAPSRRALHSLHSRKQNSLR